MALFLPSSIIRQPLVCTLACVLLIVPDVGLTQEASPFGLQLAVNPPMQTIFRNPPPLPEANADFEIRDAFKLVDSLDEFRAVIKNDGQKIRLKPGVYRAKTTAPPIDKHQHIFAVTGSGNHFDLRGVVIETPVSLQSTLTRKPHVSDSWHILGDDNVIEGGYFRNVVDLPYPKYGVNDCEFEVLGDGNTLLNCTFVIRGSIPYGYSDFYGKGGPNFGRLNKHSCLGVHENKNTTVKGCKFYVQSFGHCIYFHNTDGLRIENCFLSGTLRPTNDIFKEKVGRAKEYDFQIMYRGERPIPHDDMIPLTEDGIRSYGGDKNLTVSDTIVERFRAGVNLFCVGNVTLKNVKVSEAADHSYEITSSDKGKVVLKNCSSDVAYSPVFLLTRFEIPVRARYDVTILSPEQGVQPTSRASLGTICGDRCAFIIRDGTTRPIPEEFNFLECGGFQNKSLVNSKVTNYTTAKLILTDRTRNNVIKSVGPVEDNGKGNRIIQLKPRPANAKSR